MFAKSATWIRYSFGMTAIVIAGCRSPGSMLSSATDSPIDRTASTEQIAESIDASLRQKESREQSANKEELAVGQIAVGSRPRDNESSSATVGKDALISANMDGPPIAEQAAAAAMPPFAPSTLNPLSPAERMISAEIPPGYQARVDELGRLGGQLAAAAKAVNADFAFDVVYNPKRADTCHTDAGHILVTSAMMERLKTRNQLAVAIALEMAEHIRQLEQKRWIREQTEAVKPSTELVSDVIVNNQKIESEPITPVQIQRTASELLTRAGFSSVDLAAVQHDIQGLLADPADASATPEPTGRARWAASSPAAN